MPLALPTELWERVIDHNWGYPATLVNCSQVCRAWTARSRFHLLSSVILGDRRRTWWLASLLRQDAASRAAVNLVAVRGGRTPGTREPVAHFAALSSALAGKVPRLETLQVLDADWRPASTHRSTLLHLSRFASVTALRLARVSFPSKLVLARLVCALPNLAALSCADVVFKSDGFNPAACPPRAPRVRTIRLDGDCDDVADLFAAQSGLASGVEELRFGFSWGVQSSSQTPSCHAVKSLIQHVGASLRKLGIKMVQPSKDHNPTLGSGAAERGPISLLAGTALQSLAVHCYIPMRPSTTRDGPVWRGERLFDLLDSIVSTKFMELGIWIMVDAQSGGPPDDHDALQRAVDFLDQQNSWQVDFLLGDSSRFQRLACVQVCLVCSGDTMAPDSGSWDAACAARFFLLQAQGLLRTSVRIHLDNN